MRLKKANTYKIHRMGVILWVLLCASLLFPQASEAQTLPQSSKTIYLLKPGETWLTNSAGGQHGTMAASGGEEGGDGGRFLRLSFVQPVAQIISVEALTFTSTLVHTTDMAAIDPPSPDPSGITYIPTSNSLLISDGEVEEFASGITHFEGANLWELNLDGSLVRTANISTVAPTVVPMTNEPTGVTWNPANGHYYFSDDDAYEVFDLDPGADEMVGTADDTWTSFSTATAGNNDPEGIAYDSWQERLFVIDGANREVYQYTLSGELVGHFDVQTYGVVDPEGIEFNPIHGTLFVLSNASNRVIIEVTTSGTLLETINVSASMAVAPAGLAYAPASNGSGEWRFYIVDRGIDNNDDPNIIDGKMYEMTAPVSLYKTNPLDGAVDQPLSLSLSWTASPGAGEYQYCIDTSDNDHCNNWTSTGTATSSVINDLLAGTSYFWQVRAVDSLGFTYADGSTTAFWSFTTGAAPGEFSKTSPVNGTTDQPVNLDLIWSESSGATSYEYCYDTADDGECSSWVDNGAATSASIGGLSLGVTYYWQVRAVNSYGVTYADGTSDSFYWFSTVSGTKTFLPLVVK